MAGPVVTAGGLVFIAATKDGKIRAFNKRNGQLLWEAKLPAPGFATPAVYEMGGREYLVVACGGGKLGTKSGDAYVALPCPNNPYLCCISILPCSLLSLCALWVKIKHRERKDFGAHSVWLTGANYFV